MNIQHSTLNVQRPKHSRMRRLNGCSLSDVGCWMFLFLLFSDLPALTQTNVLPTLAPAYGQIPPTFWEQHGTTIIIGSLALLAVISLVAWKLLQPKPPVVVPPELLARRALIQLQGQPEDGKALSETSQILRRYVTTAFQLPTEELTTTEFYRALAGKSQIPLELGEAISRFLRECDVRKFSPPPFTAGVQASACPEDSSAAPVTLKRELHPAATRALELVSLAEQYRSQPQQEHERRI